MKHAAVVLIAALLLVVIGGLEAGESARQLGEAGSAPRLQPGGAGLTGLGLLASTVVYLALGWWAADDRAAIRIGAATGVAAGLIGGATRAWLISDAVRDIVARYAAVPEWFVPAALGVFVTLAVVVSAAGGAAIAFVGLRIRSSRARSAKS